MGNVDRVEPPYNGFDSQSAPASVGRGLAETSINLLPGFPGKSPVRGGLSQTQTFQTANWTRPYAVWSGSNGLYIASSAILAGIDAGFATPADALLDSEWPGGAFVNVGANVYGISNTVASSNKLLRWNGLTTGLSVTTKYLNTPNASGLIVGVAHWLQRLFILVSPTPGTAGKRYAGGSAPVSDNTILNWSDPFDPSTILPDTLAAWQDDVSGLTNQQYIDGGGRPLKPVGLARVGESLAVLGSDSIHMIRGTGPSDWVTKRTVADRGAISGDAVAEFDEGIFFVSYDGLYFYDGAELIEFSKSIRNKFRPGTFTSAQVVKLDRDYVAVTLLPADTSAAAVWAGILHVPSKGWTELRADDSVLHGGYPTVLVRAPFGTVIGDAQKVWIADPLTQPVKSPGRDTTYPVVAETASRTLRLADPLGRAKLERFGADYVQEGVAETGRGWQFDVLDQTDQTVLFTQDETVTADSVAGKRHRHIADANVEVDEVKVKSTFTGNTSTDLRGELHDVYLDSKPAQKAKSF